MTHMRGGVVVYWQDPQHKGDWATTRLVLSLSLSESLSPNLSLSPSLSLSLSLRISLSESLSPNLSLSLSEYLSPNLSLSLRISHGEWGATFGSTKVLYSTFLHDTSFAFTCNPIIPLR